MGFQDYTGRRNSHPERSGSLSQVSVINYLPFHSLSQGPEIFFLSPNAILKWGHSQPLLIQPRPTTHR